MSRWRWCMCPDGAKPRGRPSGRPLFISTDLGLMYDRRARRLTIAVATLPSSGRWHRLELLPGAELLQDDDGRVGISLVIDEATERLLLGIPGLFSEFEPPIEG